MRLKGKQGLAVPRRRPTDPEGKWDLTHLQRQA